MSTPVRSTFESRADVETVFGILTSPQWPERKAESLHDGSRVVRREERAEGGLLLAVSRELPGGVPGFLEKFLPKDGRVLQTDEWEPADGATRRGTWRVEIPGAPARLGGTMRLEQVAGGSRYTIEGDVKVSVPLIGGRAERFIADMVARLAAKENDLLQSSLPG